MTEIEALRAEVAELREEMQRLRSQLVLDLSQPRAPYVGWPVPPPVVCTLEGVATSEWPNLRMAYSDPRLTGAAACVPASPMIRAVATYAPVTAVTEETT